MVKQNTHDHLGHLSTDLLWGKTELEQIHVFILQSDRSTQMQALVIMHRYIDKFIATT